MNPAGYDLEGEIGYDILMTQGEDCRSKGRLISRIMKRVRDMQDEYEKEIEDNEEDVADCYKLIKKLHDENVTLKGERNYGD